MKTINLLLVLLIFSSCLTVKRIEKNCDKFAKVCITETEKIIEYRDTTIFIDKIIKVELPNDTVTLVDTLRIINNRVYLPSRYRKYGNVWVEAGVSNSILHVQAGLIDSTILIPVHDTIFLEKVIKEATTTNTITLPPERFVPKFYKFTFWAFWVFIAIIAAWVAWKFSPVGNLWMNIKGRIIKD